MDLLAALSLATDLGMGKPPETALRSCALATRLARAMDLPEIDVRDVCLGSLLRHLGCTATAAVEAREYGGDELVSRAAAQPADFGDPRQMLLASEPAPVAYVGEHGLDRVARCFADMST